MTTNNPFGNAQGAGLAMPASPPTLPSGGGGDGFELPADPDFVLTEFGDVLDIEGAFMFRIVDDRWGEVNNKGGVWFTLEIQDEDQRGKKLSKHMQSPVDNPKLVSFWRRLMFSITGDEASMKGPIPWKPKMYTGQFCYGKTSSFADKKMERRTGVDLFISRADYDELVAKNGHRWPVDFKVQPATAGLPAGLPGGFGAPMGAPPAGPPQPPAS